ncbi:MAG: deoxyguanosinetriphosphate triphosphohydrolase [Rhodospirillaceae bacterium]
MDFSGPNISGERAPWSSNPLRSRGRIIPEKESKTRSLFQRDRDRIIHSSAFRRLKHKTQVFIYHEGDHFRTRLTHSLEVAQVARSLSRFLRLDEDLAEALALAHDLGHTPFGHAGEEALNDVMKPWGGFDHNGQALRIVTQLESHYAEFDGLNLTWECLEGLVKHNGPLIGRGKTLERLPWSIREYVHIDQLEIGSQPGMEAQIAAFSDDIAYNTHDVDDGLRAGLFSVEDLQQLDLVGPIIEEIKQRYPNLEESRLIHECSRRMIDRMTRSLIEETLRRLEIHKPQTPEDIRALSEPIVSLTSDMLEANQKLKRFLFDRMYRHDRVVRMTETAKRVTRELFSVFLKEPDHMPLGWRTAFSKIEDTADRARLVSDYISGMTDRFALDEHRRLYSPYEKNEYL